MSNSINAVLIRALHHDSCKIHSREKDRKPGGCVNALFCVCVYILTCVCVSRQENLKLREQVSGRTEPTPSEPAEAKDEAAKEEVTKVKLEAAMTQQVRSAQVTVLQRRSGRTRGIPPSPYV